MIKIELIILPSVRPERVEGFGDAIVELIKRGERVLAYWSKNQRYDIGRPMPWLETNIRYALQHPTFKDEMRSLLKDISDELFNN